MAAGNGGQKMSQYSWFTVYVFTDMEYQSINRLKKKNRLLAGSRVHKDKTK